MPAHTYIVVAAEKVRGSVNVLAAHALFAAAHQQAMRPFEIDIAIACSRVFAPSFRFALPI